jgi:aldose 1-epimerase
VIELVAGRASARVDPTCGARIAELDVGTTPLLVTGDPRHDDPLEWGLYPMVPFAGRLRHGELPWRGEVFRLPLRRPPHAIHGTVLDAEWHVVDSTTSSCTLATPLGDPWPFAGRVEHHVALADHRLDLRLTVHADVDMPVQIGWHPWFRKPSRAVLPFRSMHRRDESGIARPEVTPVDRTRSDSIPWGDVDDCFTDVPDGLEGLLTLEIDGLVVELQSTCEHWVVFDRPTHATCVEPQSGPPNAPAIDPHVIPAGASHHETFSIEWRAIEPGSESHRLSARSEPVAPLDHREGRRP